MCALGDRSNKVKTYDVRTWGELTSILKEEPIHGGKGLKMMSVRIARQQVISSFKPALKLKREQRTADPTQQKEVARFIT